MKLLSGISAIIVIACVMTFMNSCAPNQNSNAIDSGSPVGIFEGTNDIGGVKLIGRAIYDASTQTYTLSGGGMNVWGNLDQHFYAWKKVKGDFSMTAKVAFEGPGVVAHRKIGIMIRDALTGESRCAHISIHGDGLTSLQYREEEGGPTKEIKGPPNGNYITLEKIGNKIQMRTATGVKPEAVTAEVEMAFPGAFYVGLFICSHDVDILETAYFTNVEFKKL
jgi:hypothetical protein